MTLEMDRRYAAVYERDLNGVPVYATVCGDEGLRRLAIPQKDNFNGVPVHAIGSCFDGQNLEDWRVPAIFECDNFLGVPVYSFACCPSGSGSGSASGSASGSGSASPSGSVPTSGSGSPSAGSGSPAGSRVPPGEPSGSAPPSGSGSPVGGSAGGGSVPPQIGIPAITYYYSTPNWICCSDTEVGAVNTLNFVYQQPTTISIPSVNSCTACPGGAAAAFSFSLNGISANGVNDCPKLNGTWILDYAGSCQWRTDQFPYNGDQAYFQLESAGGGVWQVYLITVTTVGGVTGKTSKLLYSVTSAAWNCKSSLILPFASTDKTCNGWPQSITLQPIQSVNVGSSASSGSLAYYPVCTCEACLEGTYSVWEIVVSGFGTEGQSCEAIDGTYQLSYDGGCTWSVVLGDGSTIVLQAIGGTWQLAVTVPGTDCGAYPPSLSVQGLGPCSCAGSSSSSGSLSGSTSGSFNGSHNGSLSGSLTGSGPAGRTIQTTCCPNALPAILYATISGPAGDAFCNGIYGTYPLDWSDADGLWEYNGVLVVNGTLVGAFAIALKCSTDNTFLLGYGCGSLSTIGLPNRATSTDCVSPTIVFSNTAPYPTCGCTFNTLTVTVTP